MLEGRNSKAYWLIDDKVIPCGKELHYKVLRQPETARLFGMTQQELQIISYSSNLNEIDAITAKYWALSIRITIQPNYVVIESAALDDPTLHIIQKHFKDILPKQGELYWMVRTHIINGQKAVGREVGFWLDNFLEVESITDLIRIPGRV